MKWVVLKLGKIVFCPHNANTHMYAGKGTESLGLLFFPQAAGFLDFLLWLYNWWHCKAKLSHLALWFHPLSWEENVCWLFCGHSHDAELSPIQCCDLQGELNLLGKGGKAGSPISCSPTPRPFVSSAHHMLVPAPLLKYCGYLKNSILRIILSLFSPCRITQSHNLNAHLHMAAYRV